MCVGWFIEDMSRRYVCGVDVCVCGCLARKCNAGGHVCRCGRCVRVEVVWTGWGGCAYAWCVWMYISRNYMETSFPACVHVRVCDYFV